ncbi:unnamed protein product [Closterium sp. NIES-53]
MTLTPLPTPVSIALAYPTSGPVTARYTTKLLCQAVYSGSLNGFHVPSFSRNLVGVRPLVSQHVGVWIEPFGETVVCVDGDTYVPLATFTAEPGSGLYTLHTGPRGQQQQQLLPLTPVTVPRQVPASHQVAASTQVAAFGQVPVSGPGATSCSCRSLAHPTVQWHHRMGHPSIPRLRTMSRQRLVLGLPRVLPSLPPSLAPPCGPYVEGRLRATPHSSLRPATEPFETLHLDVWSPASRPGPERESFFLVVVDDYSHYTIVFPLPTKSDVNSTLIQWLLTTADTRGRHVSCLHSNHGVFWTGSSGVALRFRVWGCLAIVRDTSADKILPRAVPCVFLGFPEDSSDYTFYHPPLHRFFDSRDVRFDESVPYYVRCSLLPRSPPPSLQQTLREPVFRGEDPGGASSRGAGVRAESVPVRGPGSGGAGVGAEPVTAGDSSLWGAGGSGAGVSGAGVSGVVPGGATHGGAPSAGLGEPGTDLVTSGGAGCGGGATGSLESGPGATTTPNTTPPPHPYPTRHQARVRRAPAGGVAAAAAAAAPGVGAAAAEAAAATAAAAAAAATSSSCLWSSDPRSPLSLSSFLPLSSHYYHTYRPVLSRVLASLVTDPHASFSSVSALTAAVTEFASTRCLDYATSLVAAPPTSPLAIGGGFALGCDALEDRQFELEFLAAASPHLCAMLLAPEGDPDALDIPSPCSYANAVSGTWASQWRAAMDSEKASYGSSGTYVYEVPPPLGERSPWHVDLQGALCGERFQSARGS